MRVIAMRRLVDRTARLFHHRPVHLQQLSIVTVPLLKEDVGNRGLMNVINEFLPDEDVKEAPTRQTPVAVSEGVDDRQLRLEESREIERKEVISLAVVEINELR